MSEMDRTTLAARLRRYADDLDGCIITARKGNPVLVETVPMLRQAADALVAMAWQPIDTAPKMRKILVFYRNDLDKGRTVLACYYKAHALEMTDDYADVGEYDESSGISYAPEGWYEEHDGDAPLMPLDKPPTHWMPLPPAPSTGPREDA